MFSVGYEPDLYIAETLGDGSEEIKGTTYEYVAMWANFVRIFEEQQVTNVVWAMDYSVEIRNHFEVVNDLWP